jgi:hypothetical protein
MAMPRAPLPALRKTSFAEPQILLLALGAPVLPQIAT